ncbi:MAG: hypothetical protein KTR32_13910 [Granulosicoccus sp.]|nr:hypothetical protein [Granulosicoccus sp.]
MSRTTDHLSVDGVAVEINLLGGNILDFSIDTKSEKPLRPLHVAPWVIAGDTVPESVPLVERQLAGDFFCAPFGGGADTPIHGWTANGQWISTGEKKQPDGGITANYALEQLVSGAIVTKELTLAPGHPILYQCHKFNGGTGHLPVAHHAMIRAPGGAKLSFSQGCYGVTPNTALESEPERGRSLLAYPQRFSTLHEIQYADGTCVDASVYPFAKGHEDLVVLTAAKDQSIGWSAALAQQDGFLFFSIKDVNILPETILWMSNGGRHYPPWSSRHTSVLGIEEAATSCHENHQISSKPQRSTAGHVMGLKLDEKLVQQIPYCFGAVPAPAGWREVIDIRVGVESLVLQDVSGEEVKLPFKGGHFGLQ